MDESGECSITEWKAERKKDDGKEDTIKGNAGI